MAKQSAEGVRPDQSLWAKSNRGWDRRRTRAPIVRSQIFRRLDRSWNQGVAIPSDVGYSMTVL
jgi:hypothetical protein